MAAAAAVAVALGTENGSGIGSARLRTTAHCSPAGCLSQARRLQQLRQLAIVAAVGVSAAVAVIGTMQAAAGSGSTLGHPYGHAGTIEPMTQPLLLGPQRPPLSPLSRVSLPLIASRSA